jgi:hypothetical protein
MAPRATTEQGKRARDSVVDAAAQLMYTNGVAATNVDKVLGVALANLKLHARDQAAR